MNAFWGFLLILVGGVAAVATKRSTATTQPAPAPGPEPTPEPGPTPAPSPTLDLTQLEGMRYFRRREKLSLVVWLVAWWRASGVSEDEIATMLAVAYRESGYNLDALSGPNAPDAAVGDAHSLFQITGDTAAGLGVDVRQLLPWGDPSTGRVSDAEWQRATEYNAWAALRFISQKPRWSRPSTFREATRAKYQGDAYAIARQYFCSWAGGVGRTWESIADTPPNNTPGSLGYIHVTILHKMEVLPYFRRALGLPELRELAGFAVSDVPHAGIPGAALASHRAALPGVA